MRCARVVRAPQQAVAKVITADRGKRTELLFELRDPRVPVLCGSVSLGAAVTIGGAAYLVSKGLMLEPTAAVIAASGGLAICATAAMASSLLARVELDGARARILVQGHRPSGGLKVP